MKLILRWVISAAAVGAAVYLLEGLRLTGGAAAFFGVALILGLVNAVIRPIRPEDEPMMVRYRQTIFTRVASVLQGIGLMTGRVHDGLAGLDLLGAARR